MFNGRYCDADREIGGPYEDVKLQMKWNDAWLSNMDRVGDGKLEIDIMDLIVTSEVAHG